MRRRGSGERMKTKMFACSASDWYQFCSSRFSFALADSFPSSAANAGQRPSYPGRYTMRTGGPRSELVNRYDMQYNELKC